MNKAEPIQAEAPSPCNTVWAPGQGVGWGWNPARAPLARPKKGQLYLTVMTVLLLTQPWARKAVPAQEGSGALGLLAEKKKGIRVS